MRKTRQRKIMAWLRKQLSEAAGRDVVPARSGLRALRKSIRFADQNQQARPFDEARERARIARAKGRARAREKQRKERMPKFHPFRSEENDGGFVQ